jgi:hypothetical protein
MKRLALALLLLTAAAPAQEVEQVTVYGGNLSGFWRVMGPSSLAIHLFGKVEWGALRPAYCRIDHDGEGYASHCFGRGDTERQGALETDGKHFHLAWGSMLARLVYDGEVTSSTGFEGHFAAKLVGIAVTDPDLSKGDKIAIGDGTPDGAGKVNLLRAVLNGEPIAHDPALDANIAAARELKLGRIETIGFLGRQFRPGPEGPKHPPDPDYLAAYAVEFADGETLCWLHQDDDGKLAAFQCS